MISTRIKETTKEAHQQLEKKVVLKIKAIDSPADYAAFLKYFFAYFNVVEKAVAPYITTLLTDYDKRRNASYLKADIEELGATIEMLPYAQAPSIHNAAEAIGAMYVLEGSIMGGPYIVQMLQKRGIEKGFSFFSGYGADSGRMWKAFQDVLNETGANEAAGLQIMQKAAETFARFGHVFEMNVVEN
ncbi:MAG: biliverdin-producing heme oxygenase [Niabella sp.]